MNNDFLRDISYQSILDLATDKGINASGKDEIYGCIFGRDSAITILKILRVCSQKNLPASIDTKKLKEMCRRALITLTTLQGKEFNLESGEEPGKFIHEYRTDKFEHLLKLTPAWYVYPDNTLRNYDSIDATALALIAIYRYWELTQDYIFMQEVLPAVQKALTWMITLGDKDHDHLIEYELDSKRTFGGLPVQSWTDSPESLIKENGEMPLYPIAPVEVQGYTWLTYKLWADFYGKELPRKNSTLADSLLQQAECLKQTFNETFIVRDNGLYFPVQALDGYKNQIKTVTGNPLLLLWASYKKDNKIESILEDKYVHDLVKRSFMPDMFEFDAGIRTMSTLSKTYMAGKDSYHNGSFWPKLNGMGHEGLANWGFMEEALKLKLASIKPLEYFKSPIELYIKTNTGDFIEFQNQFGQTSCRTQAWSAAVTLDLTTT